MILIELYNLWILFFIERKIILYLTKGRVYSYIYRHYDRVYIYDKRVRQKGWDILLHGIKWASPVYRLPKAPDHPGSFAHLPPLPSRAHRGSFCSVTIWLCYDPNQMV